MKISKDATQELRVILGIVMFLAAMLVYLLRADVITTLCIIAMLIAIHTLHGIKLELKEEIWELKLEKRKLDQIQ